MIKVAALSDPGNRHRVNEDAIGWDQTTGIFLVADGMGGHAAGEVASNIVRDTLLKADPELTLKQRVQQCHTAIRAAVNANRLLAGMGSTVIAAQILGEHCDLVWVGDSRAYHWRSRVLTQVSSDHSLVQELLDRGEITSDQAQHHPQRNVITQTLGVNHPAPDQRTITLKHKDWLLLCSDGLTDELIDEHIAHILEQHRRIEDACQGLLNAALAATGRDNISVLLLQYQRYRPRLLLLATLAMALAGACLALLGLSLIHI